MKNLIAVIGAFHIKEKVKYYLKIVRRLTSIGKSIDPVTDETMTQLVRWPDNKVTMYRKITVLTRQQKDILKGRIVVIWDMLSKNREDKATTQYG